MSRITRKELKTDKFALEVEHGISFFEHHKNEAVKYGAIGIAVVVLIVGYTIYQRGQHVNRQQALATAIRVQEAPVGKPPLAARPSPRRKPRTRNRSASLPRCKPSTRAARRARSLSIIWARSRPTRENWPRRRSSFRKWRRRAMKNTRRSPSSPWPRSTFADGRADQGEKVLRDLIANPTIFVSSDQATISLARLLARKKPAEARKLMDPLRTRAGSVGQVALTLLAELPPQ